MISREIRKILVAQSLDREIIFCASFDWLFGGMRTYEIEINIFYNS